MLDVLPCCANAVLLTWVQRLLGKETAKHAAVLSHVFVIEHVNSQIREKHVIRSERTASASSNRNSQPVVKQAKKVVGYALIYVVWWGSVAVTLHRECAFTSACRMRHWQEI